MPIKDSIIEFADSVRADRAAVIGEAGEGTDLELLIAPRFQRLLEALLPTIARRALHVLPEYRRAGIGRPDIAFVQAGSPARAFIELKQPYLDLIPDRFAAHNRDQFRRYCNLPVWALCNFRHIQLYRYEELINEADILPLAAIEPSTSKIVADRLIRRQDIDDFEVVLRTLANARQPIAHTAVDLARNLAYAARLVRSVVYSQCSKGLNDVTANVRSDFNEVLFARAEAGGYDPNDMDALFSDAFAQTLVFGLLLAREASGQEVDQNAHELLDDVAYPLLRGTLRALTLEEVREMLGVAFDVAFDTANSVDPELLSPQMGNDPVLYLYEDFLRVFDPKAVERYGVYYTPPEIVQLIVAEIDHALRPALAHDGILNHNVHLLDPACGTGTFLIAAANKAAELASAQYGVGSVAAEVEAFAQRMFGFELLVGPYTVSHYRMTRTVAGHGGDSGRLPIYLADTLAAPAQDAIVPHLDFLSAPMVAEREAADHVKTRSPILVVMGNPPYKRLKVGEVERLVGSDMMIRWEDLKKPVRDAGLGRSLNAFPDLYVAFWRWALWRIFEADSATGRGIVAYITNRNFLTGSGFGGLRMMLRRRFDRIRIIDFRGDRRGARPATVETDQNIFNIETGVCVLVGIADNACTENDAIVEYADVWRAGATRRIEKLALAREISANSDRIEYMPVPGRGIEALIPPGFADHDWPTIDRLFLYRSNGICTSRDSFVYSTDAKILESRIRGFLNLPSDKAEKQFKSNRTNRTADALNVPFDSDAIIPVAYRPLDMRHLYAHTTYVDWPRPEFRNAWGQNNVCLFALNDGTGRGPAVWCHGAVPDQHAFKGSGGGWIFPFHNHAPEGLGHNLHVRLVPGLSEVYGRHVSPQQVFDAILGLLSASHYAVRFAFDLENTFPHVPFPADPNVFSDAAALGAQIRLIQTYSEKPTSRFKIARLEGKARERVLDLPTPRDTFAGDSDGKILVLRRDKSLVITNVSERAWDFSISSSTLVLNRWIKARNGLELTAALQRELLDTIARLEELLHLFDESNRVLAKALEAPLTTRQIGLLRQ